MLKALGWTIVALTVGAVVAVLAVLAFPPERWLADRLQAYAGDALGTPLEIGALQLDLLDGTPSAQLADVALGDAGDASLAQVGSASASIDASALLRGELLFERVSLADTDVRLDIAADGSTNWDALLDALPKGGAADDQPASEPASLPAIEELELDNVSLRLDDARRPLTASLSLDASGSTIDADRPTELALDGTLNGVATQLQGRIGALAGGRIPPRDLSVDLQARLGSLTLDAQGSIGEPMTLQAPDLTFALAADGLADIERVAGVTLPAVPPFALDGTLLRDGDELVLRRIDGRFGDSDVAGDVRVNPWASPPIVYATLLSDRLDLDDLAGLVGAPSDTRETLSDEQRQLAAQARSDGRVIPSEPIDLLPLTQAFNGAIDYQAKRIDSATWPIDRLDVRAEVQADRLVLDPVDVGVADGRVSGTVRFDVAPLPANGILELQLSRVDLQRVMQAVGIDDDSFGVVGGRAKFWVEGASLAEMAATLDGGLFLLMTDGRLDALLAELGGLDVVESIALLLDPDKTRTDIRCAYMDLQAADGTLALERFVLDTDDTVFLGDGTVDLADESLDLTFEPHPKDVSILAAETALHVEGSFTSPAVLPGRELYARAAAAAVLASVATPAAALLPFLDSGDAQDSVYCTGLVSSLDDAR